MLVHRRLQSAWLPLLGIALATAGAAGCDGAEDEPEWQTIQSGVDGALISVWAGSPTDVWAVGADVGDGPMVLRFDGASWRRQDSGLTGDLWWVFGFRGGPVFVGGTGGSIARWDGEAFTPMSTPGVGTVFGIWGATPSDVWAVGGNLGGGGGAFAWRLDGDSWVEADGFPAELADTHAVWKVFGRSASDVWLVGTTGLVMHYDGNQFVTEDAGVTTALFTVHGTADRLFAVGGFATGVIIERDATGWRDVSPPDAGQIIGVYARGDAAYAVGGFGAVYRRDPGTGVWAPDESQTGTLESLHGVCIDDDGGVWAVGGQIQVAPFTRGVLLHKGDEIPVGGL